MAIKKFYVNTPKPGYTLDRKAKKYFSWGIDMWAGGTRIQQRGYATKEKAEDAVAQMKDKARSQRLGLIPKGHVPYLIELFQKKLDTMEGHDRTRAKRVFSYFLALLPKGIKVPELRTAHIQLFVEARQKDSDARTGSKITNHTIRREMVPIVSVLKSAYKYFEALDDYHPPRIPRPRIEKGRKERVISAAEQDALFGYLFAPPFPDEDYRCSASRRRTGQFLLFCLLTLSRPGEIAALRKSDVDLATGIVSIFGSKTRFTSTQSTRKLSITSTMRQILDERWKEARGDYLFTRSGTVTPTMYEQLKAACEKIGIKYGRIDRDAVSFHTARHTGITMLMQSGVDLKTVGKIAGHSDSQMTMYYTHSNPELVKKAGEILERKMGRELANYFPAGEGLESSPIDSGEVTS